MLVSPLLRGRRGRGGRSPHYYEGGEAGVICLPFITREGRWRWSVSPLLRGRCGQTTLYYEGGEVGVVSHLFITRGERQGWSVFPFNKGGEVCLPFITREEGQGWSVSTSLRGRRSGLSPLYNCTVVSLCFSVCYRKKILSRPALQQMQFRGGVTVPKKVSALIKQLNLFKFLGGFASPPSLSQSNKDIPIPISLLSEINQQNMI